MGESPLWSFGFSCPDEDTPFSLACLQRIHTPNPVKQNHDRGKWITSWIVMYAIGVLSVGIGFLMLAQSPPSIIVTATYVGLGCVFLLLATLVVVWKSQAALIVAIVIYGLDLILSLISLNIFAVLMHATLLAVMIVGAGATKRLADQSKVVTQPQIQPEFPT